MALIKKKLYKQIIETMPIPCIDCAVRYKDKLLLLKRNDKPLKNKWCFPGGRIYKNESFREAAHRKLKEETNLTGKIITLFGPYETMFKYATFDVKTGTHTINTVALVEVSDISSLKLDKNHSAYRFFSSIGKAWHPYIKRALKDCNFFKE